ncbi:tetratricopeptide repeat protein [Nocardia suismassiliense]|uniref:Tetratricopeptide repeat protein n=1 Tax=Nocardia suismassiliense TaxID=2077092 RepID=A0ABW6QTE7_9NOCA
MVSAAFGLARQLAAVDRVVDAVHALGEVPAPHGISPRHG